MREIPCLIFLLTLHPQTNNKLQEIMPNRLFAKRHYLTLLSTVFLFCAGPTASAQTFPYQNPQLTAQERAKDLCGRLTLEEKAQLMLDESPAIPRLGIKKFFWWSEALHGAANMGNVTNFPEPVGMASSFNPDLLFKVFDIASTEFRAQYNHRMYDLKGEDMKMRSLSVWTPNVNIFRDPRWGRGQETYGEDPYLTSVMGDAVVRGLQGPEDAKYRKLWACAKHYAVHSGPEYTRHSANLTNVPVRDFWETYMPAFKKLVVDSKVREVMCAYQRLDDDPCCGSNRLLQQILRDEWGFQYLVVSDCGAVSDFYTSHKSSSSPITASAKATLAGTDVECGYGYAYRSIPEAVRRGLITEAEVDKHVIRLLEGRFDLGEMDDPSLVEWSKIPYSAMSTKESAKVALDMARQAIVLLQNNGNILPLKKNAEKIAVIGPNAQNEPMMWGNYNGTPNHTITILDGIKAKQKKLLYLPGCDLTNDKVMECHIATECVAPDGKKGIKGTFWNNTKMEGKPFTTEYYTKPVNVTTAGMHVFAPNLPIEDFSAKYETTFTAKEAGEYVVNVESTGHFELYINGEKKFTHHIWRATPTRTVLNAEKGQQFQIEVRFQTVKTWGASMKIDVARELPIDYSETIAKLKGIDKVIFCGGIAPSLEGEEMPVNIEGFKGGDRTSIELPKVQREFLKALKAAGKQVIYVNCSGSAIALQPETESCDAIIQAWYPGQEGGTAVADVIFGDYNPGGKLSVTFYKNDSQLPDYEDYSMKGRTYRYFNDALFPFGFGLSYTTFAIGDATIDGQNGSYKVSIPVSNSGQKNGTEIVQLYIRNTADAEGPLKSLRGFQRVDVKAGQSATATIELKPESFEFWDAETNTMRTKPGTYEILYGNSSSDKDLKRLTVTF
jgi:beta-glucosidase